MERLTKWMGEHAAVVNNHANYIDRLAAYEDTGLEPEGIADLVSVREITPEAEYAINKHADSLIERMDALLHADDSELEAYCALGSIDHLRELVQRDTAQMCKAQTIGHGIGVTGEYDIDYNLICPSCGAVVGDAEYNELNGPFCHECGQRLALPCEDAEAALEGATKDG